MQKIGGLNLGQYGECLPNEDRSYGGNAFYVDMVPASAFHSNLRAMLPLAQWKELSTYVRARNHERCEICNSALRLEAHERWHFDPQTRLQTLKRIMCLCKQCHLSVHIGLAGQLGLAQSIHAHIMEITGWTKKQLTEHVDGARDEWSKLSKGTWNIDVSMVQAIGMTIASETDIKNKIAGKNDQLSKEQGKLVLRTGIGTDDEFSVSLTAEVRANWVVVLAEDDADLLDGIALSNTLGLLYVAKPKESVNPDRPTLSAAKFVHAFTNPTPFKKGAHVKAAKDKPNLPVRFMVTSTDQIPEEDVAKFLPLGFIFTMG